MIRAIWCSGVVLFPQSEVIRAVVLEHSPWRDGVLRHGVLLVSVSVVVVVVLVLLLLLLLVVVVVVVVVLII